MKVELSIADDRELKAHIRDVIKGEIVSIARGEIKGIIAQVVAEKTIPSDPDEMDAIVRQTIREHVRQSLGTTSSYGRDSWIKTEAREAIRDMIAECMVSKKII